MRANKELPRQSIRTLIRKAIFNRYGMRAIVKASGEIVGDGWCSFDHVDDWYTTRNSARCVELRRRDELFFKFSPDA